MGLFTDEQLSLLTDDQLLNAIQHMTRVYKGRSAAKDIVAVFSFAKDDRVEYAGKGSNRLPAGTAGRIKSVNQRTVTVDFGPLGEWRIGGQLLRKAAAGKQYARVLFDAGGLVVE